MDKKKIREVAIMDDEMEKVTGGAFTDVFEVGGERYNWKCAHPEAEKNMQNMQMVPKAKQCPYYQYQSDKGLRDHSCISCQYMALRG